MATRQSLFRAARAQHGQDLLGDLSNPRIDGIKALEKACYLRLGATARQNGETQTAMNAIAAVRELERGEARSDEASDEFSHVLWSQREHSLAIQLVEEMLGSAARSGEKNKGRQAVLLSRIVSSSSLCPTIVSPCPRLNNGPNHPAS